MCAWTRIDLCTRHERVPLFIKDSTHKLLKISESERDPFRRRRQGSSLRSEIVGLAWRECPPPLRLDFLPRLLPLRRVKIRGAFRGVSVSPGLKFRELSLPSTRNEAPLINPFFFFFHFFSSKFSSCLFFGRVVFNDAEELFPSFPGGFSRAGRASFSEIVGLYLSLFAFANRRYLRQTLPTAARAAVALGPDARHPTEQTSHVKNKEGCFGHWPEQPMSASNV